MAKLVISPSARQDLSDIFDYIARDKPVAAAHWVEKIEQKLRLISATPDCSELRPEYGSDIRSSVVGLTSSFIERLTAVSKSRV